MKILSWNVNGLRAAERKGFLDFLATTDADVVLLQETKSSATQLSEAVLRPRGWHVELAPAERPGYAGVAVYSRRRPGAVTAGIGIPCFDREGRVLIWLRIDYHLVDRALLPRVRAATIHPEVLGSDHCPVGLVLGVRSGRAPRGAVARDDR